MKNVKFTIFPGRRVESKLYNVGVYETSGHFD